MKKRLHWDIRASPQGGMFHAKSEYENPTESLVREGNYLGVSFSEGTLPRFMCRIVICEETVHQEQIYSLRVLRPVDLAAFSAGPCTLPATPKSETEKRRRNRSLTPADKVTRKRKLI